MSIFTVIERRRGAVESVLLRTDDWVEAERAALTPWPRDVEVRSVWGVHPSHRWDDRSPRRCVGCNGWDNGSYGSHAPCGYWQGESLVSAIERETAARAES